MITFFEGSDVLIQGSESSFFTHCFDEMSQWNSRVWCQVSIFHVLCSRCMYPPTRRALALFASRTALHENYHPFQRHLAVKIFVRRQKYSQPFYIYKFTKMQSGLGRRGTIGNSIVEGSINSMQERPSNEFRACSITRPSWQSREPEANNGDRSHPRGWIALQTREFETRLNTFIYHHPCATVKIADHVALKLV